MISRPSISTLCSRWRRKVSTTSSGPEHSSSGTTPATRSRGPGSPRRPRDRRGGSRRGIRARSRCSGASSGCLPPSSGSLTVGRAPTRRRPRATTQALQRRPPKAAGAGQPFETRIVPGSTGGEGCLTSAGHRSGCYTGPSPRSVLELRKASLQEAALGVRVDEFQSALVGRAGLFEAIQSAQQLRAGRVQVVVVVELEALRED
jgi:hypothetical protein